MDYTHFVIDSDKLMPIPQKPGWVEFTNHLDLHKDHNDVTFNTTLLSLVPLSLSSIKVVCKNNQWELENGKPIPRCLDKINIGEE